MTKDNTATGRENQITVYIPHKDRPSALKRCISYIKQNNLGLVKEIIVIDNSTNPIKDIPGVKILRKEFKTWNKAWLLNCGIKEYPNEYIMTVDVDMLLDKVHFLEISKNLTKNSFICDTNVRRIEKENITDNYVSMIEKSYPWRNQDVNQLFNTANGGIQVYPKELFEYVNGIQEGLGLYHGAVDNVMYYRARMSGMNVIDIAYPLLHVEHKKQKEDHYEEGEKQIATEYRGFKVGYLNYMIKNSIVKNPEKIAGSTPDMTMFYEFKNLLANKDKLIQEAFKKGQDYVVLGYNTFKLEKAKPSIMVAVIGNYGSYPDYFVWDLFQMYLYTKAQGYTIDLCPVSACENHVMRNVAVKMAIGELGDKKYDYLVMLDLDHTYPQDFLVKFLNKMERNNWPIMTGLTSGKKHPYKNTQYYKIQEIITSPENAVDISKPREEVIKIEASGPVGMVMSTKVLKQLKWPYYSMDFTPKKVIEKKLKEGKIIEEEKLVDSQLGSDLNFCKKLKELCIPIRLDLSVAFPHEKRVFLSYGKISDETYTN